MQPIHKPITVTFRTRARLTFSIEASRWTEAESAAATVLRDPTQNLITDPIERVFLTDGQDEIEAYPSDLLGEYGR